MTLHRPPGPSVPPLGLAPVLGTPDTRPSPAQLTARALRQRLDEARTDYAEGRTSSAARVAREVEDTARYAIATSDDPGATASVAGMAATLQGLCAGADGADALAVEAFTRDLDAFEPTDPAAAEVAQYTAYRGIALAMTDRPGEAVPLLRQALGLGEDTPDVRRCLGISLRHSGQVQEAREVLEDAVRHAPDDWRAAEVLAALLDEAGADSVTRADAWQQAATAQLDAGRFERAVATAERAAELAEDNVIVTLTLGWALAAQGRYAEARDSFERTLELDAELAPALVGHADASLNLSDDGNPEAAAAAEATLRRAIELDPSSGQAHALLGEALRRQGRYPEALASLDEALRLIPGYPYASATTGLVLLDSGRPREAIKPLTTAVEAEPDDPSILILLAYAYLGSADPMDADGLQRDAGGAVKHLLHANTLDRQNPEVLALLAQARIYQGRLDVARTALRESLNLDPGNWDRAAALVEVLLQLGRPQEALDELARHQRAEVPALRGRALYAMDRYQEAVESLKEALAVEGSTPDTLYLLGDSYRLLGRLDDALDSLDGAIALDPEADQALAARGVVHSMRGENPEALTDLEQAVEFAPGNVFAVRRLWLLHNDLGHPDRAVEAVKGALARDEDNIELLKEHAFVLNAVGRQSETQRVLDDVLWRSPDDFEALQLLGWSMLDSRRRPEALAAFRRALRAAERTSAAPEQCAAVLADLASAQNQCGRFTAALRTVNRALEVSRNHATLLTKGQILADVAAWPQALDVLREAVRTPPYDSAGYSLLGWALEHDEGTSPEEVYQAYRRASELAVGDPNVRRDLADGLWLLGKADEAGEEYRWAADNLGKIGSSDAQYTRGWCLYRLGQSAEASSAYLRALPGSTALAPLLFDIGLNALEAADDARARDAYHKAFAEVAKLALAKARGPLSVALVDLRDARRLSRGARGGAAFDELEQRLVEELASRPLPQIA